MAENERDAITKRNRKESPFFRLPGELRNKIYRSYLSTATIDVKTHFVGDIGFSNWTEHTTITRRENNLSLICIQVYEESQPYLNDYRSLRVISGGGFDSLMKEMCHLSLYRHLGATQRLEIEKKTALDMISCQEKPWRQNDDWLLRTNQSRQWYYHYRIPSASSVFPALEVVVWPRTASQVPLEKREAAVRYCFDKSDIQVVLGSI